MNDIAEKISEVVAESMAARQAEMAALLERVRNDIESLQRALNTFPGTAPQADAKRAPAANGRRRRRKTQAPEKAETSQAASSKTAAKRTRREKTAEERGEISKRMTAYWQRKRGEKAGSRG